MDYLFQLILCNVFTV